MEVFGAHPLKRRKLPITGVVDQHIKPPKGVHR
jgi:hypothetical protein